LLGKKVKDKKFISQRRKIFPLFESLTKSPCLGKVLPKTFSWLELKNKQAKKTKEKK
jgi:hypothetical protein